MKKMNLFALSLLILGMMAIVLKSFTPEYIDAQGILHEWFFLVPVGFGAIFLSLCLLIVSLFVKLITKSKARNI